jgi:hypothetical protein
MTGALRTSPSAERWPQTPKPSRVLAERVRQLLAAGEITVLLGRTEPNGLAVLRFRPALWRQALDSYLEELYGPVNYFYEREL